MVSAECAGLAWFLFAVYYYRDKECHLILAYATAISQTVMMVLDAVRLLGLTAADVGMLLAIAACVLAGRGLHPWFRARLSQLQAAV